MDETETDEKLLSGPEPEKLLPAAENFPLLNAEEFLKRTPPRELKNIFGLTESRDVSKQEALSVLPVVQTETATPTPKTFQKFFPRLAEKESPKSALPITVMPKEKKSRRWVVRFAGSFFLLAIIVIVGLYIWGGVIK